MKIDESKMPDEGVILDSIVEFVGLSVIRVFYQGC